MTEAPFVQPLDAIVPVDPNHPSPAEINAAALRIAAQVNARHAKESDGES